MTGHYRIEGYVIASADGMLADSSGVMPVSLQLEADQRYFEDALEDVALVVNGRHSQEIQTRSAKRRRLILTSKVHALTPDAANPKALLWNPAAVPFEEAAAALGVFGGMVAIVGGPRVYSLFLKTGYDAFHLCRAVRVRLPGGVPVFSRELLGGEPDAALAAAGLTAGQMQMLDPDVSLVDWTRPV
jgi:dihydrofolate reductase